MRGNPFFSRNNAFLFAGATIIAAMIAVGGEDDDGAVDHTAQELTQQRDDFGESIAEFQQPEDAALEPESALDETELPDTENEIDDFLIDDTQGFDPSPADDTFAPMLDTSDPGPVQPDEAALPDEDLSPDE